MKGGAPSTPLAQCGVDGAVPSKHQPRIDCRIVLEGSQGVASAGTSYTSINAIPASLFLPATSAV